MSFPRYPAYKESGVEWLGEVPQHWSVMRLGQIGRLSKGNGGTKQDETAWGVPCVRYGDLYTTHNHFIRETRSFVSEEGALAYTPIQYGDVLLAASGETLEEIGKSAVNLMQRSACCGGDVIVLRPTVDVNPVFFGYALDCPEAQAQKAGMGRGFTVVHIYSAQLKSLAIGIPPLLEQAAIATFLDRETAKIDALVTEYRTLIELLKEKRQAVISHAVTKGLDPTVPMKDSGVEWLGEVPEHWRVATIRRLSSAVKTGGTPSEYPAREETTEGVPWYTPGDFNGNSIRLATAAKQLPAQAVEGGEATLFPKGSVLVVCIGATLGKVGFIDRVSSANQQINAILPAPDIQGDFLAYSLAVKGDVMRLLSNASTIGIMNQEKTKEIWIAASPIKEQIAIVEVLDAKTGELDALVSEAEQAISLLQERRTALISAAVTGKIDVRGLVGRDEAA